MEPVYTPVIAMARGIFAAQGLRFRITGAENVPISGGAVMVINHTGYLDFTYAGLPAHQRGRVVRFMCKDPVFRHPVAGPLMRGMRHIPVDREAGASSFRAALTALKSGEIVGVFPEATISRSFELKAFKSGAARMAIEAGVPIVPHVVWGAQRVWTKGHPKHLGRTNTPIFVGVCEPLDPVGPPEELTARLHEVMGRKLLDLQAAYPEHPAGAYWVPARLGGSAPTLEEANAMDVAEQEEKRRKRDVE